MPPRLQDELKQTKPFASLEQEALLSIERTAAVLRHQLGEELKPLGVTPTQYNVLRILRGAGPAGLCRNEIRDRLVAQVPDVTRLLDRMEDAGLIVRGRDSAGGGLARRAGAGRPPDAGAAPHADRPARPRPRPLTVSRRPAPARAPLGGGSS
jgi:hypothetical protein